MVLVCIGEPVKLLQKGEGMYTQSHELYGLDYATRLGFLDYDPTNNNVCVCFAAISHVYQARVPG